MSVKSVSLDNLVCFGHNQSWEPYSANIAPDCIRLSKMWALDKILSLAEKGDKIQTAPCLLN